jgi:hypothetical protein
LAVVGDNGLGKNYAGSSYRWPCVFFRFVNDRTTVGYGDRFPVTTGGRIIGVILMTAGGELFGTFAGFVSSWFLSKGEEKT